MFSSCCGPLCELDSMVIVLLFDCMIIFEWFLVCLNFFLISFSINKNCRLYLLSKAILLDMSWNFMYLFVLCDHYPGSGKHKVPAFCQPKFFSFAGGNAHLFLLSVVWFFGWILKIISACVGSYLVQSLRRVQIGSLWENKFGLMSVSIDAGLSQYCTFCSFLVFFLILQEDLLLIKN